VALELIVLAIASEDIQALMVGLLVILPNAQLPALPAEFHFAELRNIP
jgi:hypothetical protein